MKKVVIFIAAAVAALSFSSCNKIENVAEENHGIKFNISVASPDGPDTKAVKTCWENGDKINIWFDGHWQKAPELVLTYDGSKWNAGEISDAVKGELVSSGTFNALYEGSNSLSSWTGIGNSLVYVPTGYNGEPANSLTLVSNAVSYSFENDVLSAEISSWEYITRIQVVVPAEYTDASKWALICNSFPAFKYFQLTDDKKISISPTSNRNFAAGVPNADGVAFYYPKNFKDDYYFTLHAENGNNYKYNITGKTITVTSPTSFKAIKLPALDLEDDGSVKSGCPWVKE